MVSLSSDDPDGNRATIARQISDVVRSILGTESFRVVIHAADRTRIPLLEREPRHTSQYQVELEGKANTPENWDRLASHPKWSELQEGLTETNQMKRLGQHEVRLARPEAKVTLEKERLAERFQARGELLERVGRGEMSREVALATFERSWLSRTEIHDERTAAQFRADMADMRRRVDAEAARALQVQTPVRSR